MLPELPCDLPPVPFNVHDFWYMMKRRPSKPLLLAGAILGAGGGFVYVWKTGQPLGWRMVVPIIFLAMFGAIMVVSMASIIVQARSSKEIRHRALWGGFTGVMTGMLLLFTDSSFENILFNTLLLSLLFAWLLVDDREGQRLSLRSAVPSIFIGGLVGLMFALFLDTPTGGDLFVFIGALLGFLSAKTVDFFFFSA